MVNIAYTNLPASVLRVLGEDKRLSLCPDDFETQPHILILYNTDLYTTNERLSALDKNKQTDVIYIGDDLNIKQLHTIMNIGVSVVCDVLTKPKELLNIIQTIIASNIYNAATHSKKWKGMSYIISDDTVYCPSEGKFYYRDNTDKTLNPKEQLIMNMLCDNIGSLIPKKEFLYTIWGEVSHKKSRSFDVYINRLRHAIVGDGPTNLRKTRGSGYQIINDERNKTINNKY